MLKILRILNNKYVYLLSDLFIFLLGYCLIREGFIREASDKLGPILISIGTSLIASGIIILLDLWKKLSVAGILEKMENVIRGAGINYVFPKRDLDKYDVLMANLSKELDICGYSLVSFFDSYRELLKSKSTKGIKVRIIVVDPDSQFSKHRAEIEGNQPNDYKNKIARMRTYLDGVSGIEIRKLAAPLSTMIFRIDTIMFIGPHFFEKTSKSSVTYELRNKGWLYKEYLEEFERMWAKSTLF